MLAADYKILPESMESDELAGYFKEFLSEYSDKPRTLPALKQLYELAYRQWDTYEPLDEKVSESVQDYLMNAIDFNNHSIMDTILSISENLTLRRVFNYIVDNKNKATIPSIAALIDEAEEEYGDMSGDLFDDVDDW